MLIKFRLAIYSFMLVFVTASITKYLVNFGLVPFYDLLNVPSVTPDKQYFRYIWNVIYILLFIGFYWALISEQTNAQYADLNTLFIMQLFLQILWTFCFFYIQHITASVLVIILLDVVAALFMHTLFFINIWSFFLILPYFLWLLFATFLNIYIIFFN